jgi:hypothetical protein
MPVPSVILVDARCLQEKQFSERGVGQHGMSLIDALRRRDWDGVRPRIVGLVDKKSLKLKLSTQWYLMIYLKSIIGALR